MAKKKGIPLLAGILAKQIGKIFKNSECEVCGCYLCNVKMIDKRIMCYNCACKKERK